MLLIRYKYFQVIEQRYEIKHSVVFFVQDLNVKIKNGLNMELILKNNLKRFVIKKKKRQRAVTWHRESNFYYQFQN